LFIQNVGAWNAFDSRLLPLKSQKKYINKN